MLARFWHGEQRRLSLRHGIDDVEWGELSDDRRQLLEATATLTLLRVFPERMAVRHEPAADADADTVACNILGHPLRAHDCLTS
jgi:hypothetical protein